MDTAGELVGVLRGRGDMEMIESDVLVFKGGEIDAMVESTEGSSVAVMA